MRSGRKAIHYNVDPDAEGLAGVVAMEGYLRKFDGTAPAEFDYSDGRFGDPDTDDPFAAGTVKHSGLAGHWVIPEACDRMSIALVRYDRDLVVTESRFFVNIHVEHAGDPDFAIDKSIAKQFRGSAYRSSASAGGFCELRHR